MEPRVAEENEGNDQDVSHGRNQEYTPRVSVSHEPWRPEQRKRGIADHPEDHYADMPLFADDLVGRDNDDARAFYRARGFRDRNGFSMVDKDL